MGKPNTTPKIIRLTKNNIILVYVLRVVDGHHDSSPETGALRISGAHAEFRCDCRVGGGSFLANHDITEIKSRGSN